MANRKVGGTCYFKLDGEVLALEGGLEVPLVNNEREYFSTSAGAYFSEKEVIPSIKGTFAVPEGFPIKKINDATNMTITAELANGMTYVLRDAARTNAATLKTDEGNVDLEFAGVKGEFL